jgi:anti-sigma B factor antagonist
MLARVGDTSGGSGATIDVRDEAGLVVVTLGGEHDIATAPDVRAAIESAQDRGTTIVDLTPSRFVDSTILGVLIAARDRARARGAGFAVLHGQDAEPGVRRILDITGLVPLLPVVESLDAAREAAAG